ncbi:MAG: hypothetical protein FWD22_02610 [Treponema sp.]|nr:hypothetical protein [Treponema sp.]
MKKIFIFLLVSILIAGTVSAQAIREQQADESSRARTEQRREAAPQGRNNQQRNANPQTRNSREGEINLVKVEGTLKLERGLVAIESGNSTYFVPMLNRYIGFIGGLKEGARVTVEGRGFRNAIQPTKVTIDGKTYDFFPQTFGSAQGRQSFEPRRDNTRPGQNRSSHNHGRNSGQKHKQSQNRCRCCSR